MSVLYYFFDYLPTQKDEKLELEAIKISQETAEREAYQEAVRTCKDYLSKRISEGDYSLVDPNLSSTQNSNNWMETCMPSLGYKWK